MTCQSLSSQEKLNLESWGLPKYIVQKYKSKGLTSMFPWQLECLMSGNVLDGGNLVYSAPTSAGKTLVAEIITLQTVLERKKKVIIILPFVSVVREKMLYFKDLLVGSGIRVEGFMGSYHPPGGFRAVHIAICTIEKANSLINRLMEEKNLENIGCVVVDELHLLGDPHRGYLLELLLTKLRYICKKGLCPPIQIIGMSATLPNLEILSKWLDAALYVTDFRPIPLTEYLKVNRTLLKVPDLTNCGEVVPEFIIDNDPGDVIYLCIDTILKGFSALVFCPTKNWCETLAMQIAREVMRLGCGNEEVSAALRRQLKSEAISDTLDQLKNSPVGLESALGKSISFGVAFHHAGLTLDERDIIEGGFKTGTLRVLVATSTLSAGVNLPARRVIVRSPQFGGSMMDIRTYKQMVGRAGRMGQDTAGESYLLCTDGDKSIGQRLTTSSLPPVESSLGNSDLSNSLKRAILEIIASGLITSYAEVECYTSCTMLAAYEDPAKINEAVQKCVKYLTDKGFIDLKNETEISASSLAEACLSASMSPDQGLTLLAELDKARKNFVLESDLHAVYQVTPFSVSNQWGLDWMKAFSIWEKLPKSTQKVGHLVGVEDRFLIRAMRGSTNFQADSHRVAVHKRFFTALALQDLITEMPLTKVVEKYGCNKGMLQSLQQSASTFSGMVTNFCRKLGWGALEVVVSQLGQRIQFGAHRDLLDLLKLDCLTAVMARSLYNSEITTVADLAQASMRQVEAAIRKALPYASSQENDSEREKKDVSLPGRPGLTVSEAADLFIKEARTYIMREMGVDHVQWNDHHASPDIYDMSTVGPGSRDTTTKDGTTKDESLNVSVASANFEHVNQSDRRIGLPSTSSVKFDLETKTEDDKSEPELELKLALSEENDGNDEKESEEESGQGSLSSSKFTSLLNISNPCIPKLSSQPASTSGSVSGDDVGPSYSEDVVPTSQDLETEENVGGKTNRSSVALFLNNSKATPTTKEGLPKDLTDYSNLQISNFSNLFGDSFSRESPVERSKVARFRNGVESSTPIVNKVTSVSKTPADSGKGSQSARSPLLFQTPNSAGADFSDGDMFDDSGTHRRLSASMICAINSNQPLDDFDPNWGGDSLLLASQVVESHKKEALNLKRKLAEESPLSNREAPSSKRKCVLSVHKTKAKKCSSRNDSLSTAENSSLNAQQLNIVDLESDPFRLRAEERNIIEQVDTPPSLKDNKVLPGSRNSLTDSVLAQVFQDSFGPADGKSSDPGTPEMFESPQKRPRAEDSTNIVLKFEATSRPDRVTAHVSLAQPPSNPTTPTKLNTSPGKYSPLGVSVVKCSRSPRTSPSEKEKSRNGRIDRSKRSQSTCKKLLKLPDNQVDPLKTGQPSGIERLKPNINTDGKAKKLKKFKSETWGKSDPVESQLITGSTPEACSEPIESQPTKAPITPTKFSGPVDLSKIADVLEICTSGANLEDFLDTVDRRKEMAFCLETAQYSSTESKIGMKVVRSKCPVEKEPDFHDSAVAIVGIYMVVDRKLFHCCLRSSKCICIGKLKMIFRRKDIRLIGYDLSWQIKLLHQCCDIAIDSLLWDVCVADWLLDPRDGKTPLKQLAKDLLDTGDLSHANLQSSQCASDCFMIWGLKPKLSSSLEKNGLLKPFLDTEMPLRRLLVFMELSGMPFDQGLATQLWNRVRETMDSLEDQIYMKARKRFSLSSRKDLKKVKESLNIKAGDTEHPFIVNIHNWRKLSSLKSRNLSPLLMTHLKDGRCRGQSCSFTVTGRIVMHNPNLQHIPRDFTVNNELFSLRSAFVAKPGNVILSADYCQLELRILAHFSQDPDLLSSIHNEADVFVSIAAKWNNISPDKVTDDIRHQTKQIIYGIIYGMGDRALGDALGIDPPEAALLAAKFRRSYPGVQRFMDACIADCRRKGYVTTLTGRVRRLKGISSSSPSVRAQAERQAVNSTIQGSAADIAKSATLRVESKLAESIENRGHVLTPLSASHLILHLHDELIYEVSNDYVEAVKETLKTEMAGAVQLKVALPVVVKCGPSWGQMKKI